MFELASNLKNTLHHLGEFSYSYYAIRKTQKTKPFILSTYPSAWLDVYKAKNYHLIDPVINYGLRNFTPFSWREAQAFETSDRRDVLFKDAEKYQISSGFTFVLHDAAGVFASLSICNSGLESDFDQCVADHSAGIQMALICFHDRLLSIRTAEELFPLTFNTLSAREIEVLKWVGIGKAYCEVAIICAISVHTVKFHISKICIKLDVLNAKQAVYEAKRMGII